VSTYPGHFTAVGVLFPQHQRVGAFRFGLSSSWRLTEVVRAVSAVSAFSCLNLDGAPSLAAMKQNANEGCNRCASLTGLVLSFIACFILLVIGLIAPRR